MRTAADNQANCLSNWFPKLAGAGLPVPETRIVKTDVELIRLLHGEKPEGLDGFEAELRKAVAAVGLPCFLRTGQGSGKHEWDETCFVRDGENLLNHVVRLAEWSFTVDIFGLPCDVWVARRMIETEPLFHAFWRMPITREFRFFVRDGEVDHVQPYWPPDSIVEPSRADWKKRLEAASRLTDEERDGLGTLASHAVHAVGGGFWSVDLLQAGNGKWWITDMALGEMSYRWESSEVAA